MLSFLQPARMENDQIYQLSIRPFTKRLGDIVEILAEIGELETEIAELLKIKLQETSFIKEVYSPGLHYFTYYLTTYTLDEVIYNYKQEELAEYIKESGQINKFLSYFIVPFANNGIKYEFVVGSEVDGTIQIPGLNYLVQMEYKSKDLTVVTSINEISFYTGRKNVGSILLDNAFKIDNPNMLLVKKYYDEKSNIGFEICEQIISDWLVENISTINIRKSNKTDHMKSIDFTVNDHIFYKTCLDLIERVWPEYYIEMKGHIKLLAIMDTDAFGGFTTDILPDAIFISHHPNDFLWVTENIIHECAHSRLNQLFVIDPIVVNDHTETFNSPWRSDARPMKGVFHGAYAFARVYMWLEKLQKHIPSAQTEQRLEVVRNQLLEAVRVIEDHGKLSPIGEHVFNEISSILNPLKVTN